MEQRRQPVEQTARMSPQRLQRLIQKSPTLMHALQQSKSGRLTNRTGLHAETSSTDRAESSSCLTRVAAVERCEICLSLNPEDLEVQFRHRRQADVTGVLHHSFEDLEKSAAGVCDLCQILLWAIHRTTYSQNSASAMKSKTVGSLKERFYLRLTKSYAKSGYSLPPSLTLCAPIVGLTPEDMRDREVLKWAQVARTTVCNELVATETASIAVHPDSPEVYNQIKTWLKTCGETHVTCAALSQKVTSAVLPKRLIDLGDAGSTELPRLVKTQGGNYIYVALSYTWGPEGNHVVLTRSNEEALSSGLKSSLLPQTFQDAILVCRKLDVRYLWIDALCITQSEPMDDTLNEELSHEIHIMGEIYTNAIFTIASASASNVRQGLFGQAKRFPISLEPRFLYTKPTSTQWYVIPPEPDWQTMVVRGPLQSRAWVMQERTLSRRILHYTHSVIFWECTELKASEFRPSDIMSAYYLHDPKLLAPFSGCYKGLPLASKTPLSADEKSELLTNVWANAVGDYSRRRLTADTDMLPAISAIAQAFQRLTNDTYLAGLWQSVFWLNLMWYTGSLSKESSRRPTKYTAPSWSWASVVGSTVMTSRDRPTSQGLTVLSVSTLPSTPSNPYGHVKGGTLCIKGSLRKAFRATRRRTGALIEHYIRKPPSIMSQVETEVEGVLVKFDVPLLNRPESRVYFDIRSDEELEFCVLQLCGLMQSGFKRNGHPFFFGMAIVPTEADEEFRRIGFVEVCDEDFFDDPNTASVTLTLV